MYVTFSNCTAWTKYWHIIYIFKSLKIVLSSRYSDVSERNLLHKCTVHYKLTVKYSSHIHTCIFISLTTIISVSWLSLMILVCIAVHETCVAFYIACDWSPSVYNVNEAHCSVLKELGKGVVREFFFFFLHTWSFNFALVCT